MLRYSAVLGLLLSARPRLADACAVCFGKSAGQEGLASGLFWGISILLAFTFCILGVLAAAIIRIEKNRSAADIKP